MNTIPFLRLTVCAAVAGACLSAHAVVEEGLVPEFAVRDKLDEDARAAAQGSVPLAEREHRRAAAKQRAEKIRALPADRVADWMRSSQTDQELHRLSAEPMAAQTPPRPQPKSPARLIRLSLTAATAIVLAILLHQRRKSDGARAAKQSGKRP